MSDKKEKQAINLKKTFQKKERFLYLGSIFFLFCVFVFSFCLGRYPLSCLDVLSSLGRGITHWINQVELALGIPVEVSAWPSRVEDTMVWMVRMPRIFAAVLAGSALALSGATYQGLFRNPMVSPDILGVSAGASFGSCLMMLLNQGYLMIQVGAFVMGLGAVILSYLLSKSIGRGHSSTLLLVLCGMTVNALFQAFVSITKYLADTDSQLPEMTYWLMGSLAKASISNVFYFAGITAIFSVPLLLLRWRLNILSFDEDEARMMGVNTSALRLICIICSSMLTASVVSMAGTIGWVGLMIPHIVRFLSGPNNKTLLPISMTIGASFLLIVDNLCRTLLAYEIPLGVLTSLMGVPFFIIVLFRQKRGSI